MFRWLVSGLQALMIVVLLPVLIPDGNGATQQHWKKLLVDPVKAWQFDYYLDPYRSLFQAGRRLLRGEDEPVAMQMYKAQDGSLHVSNLPDAKGKTVVIRDSNADLVVPTKFQGALTLLVCWLLVLSGLQWFKSWRMAYHRPRPVTPVREKMAEFIPYTVDSRVIRPLRDMDVTGQEPRSERQADKELRLSSLPQEKGKGMTPKRLG